MASKVGPDRGHTEKPDETMGAVAVIAAELLFAVLPLLVIAIVMIYRNEGARAFASPEWSFGSAILCGQALVKFVAGLSSADAPKWQSVSLGVALLFVLGVVPALVVLALMVVSDTQPPAWLVRLQIAIFVVSICEFFLFGTVGHLWLERRRARAST